MRHRFIGKLKKSIPPIPREVWRNPLYFIAFGFGLGAIPIAPGTFATLGAALCYLFLGHLSDNAYLIFVLCFTVFSAWLSDYLSKQTHTHDHPGMCIDEFVGFFVAMLYGRPDSLLWIFLGFVLFRFFDIVKPWPISYIDDHVHGGIGMVLDDVVAGLFTCILLHLLVLIIPL